MQNYKKSIGAFIGNTMQFYDFTLYALLAPQIKQAFFNFDNNYLSYLVVVSVFACGYLTRPLGSMLFGYLGDRKGRSFTLSITIILASVTTVLIGLLPTYQILGWLSPIFLLILRLLQGIAVSGEEGNAVVLLFEKYAFKQERLIGSAVLSSVLVGVLLGTIICALVSQAVSPHAYAAWGWRLPFLLAFPLGSIAILMRFYLNDFNLFELAEKNNLTIKKPLKVLFKEYRTTIVFGFFIVVAYSIPTCTLIVHIPYYLTVNLGYSQNNGLMIVALSIVSMMVLTPLFAKWLEKIPAFSVYKWSLVAMMLISPCLFYVLSVGSTASIIAIIALFSLITAMISSTIFALLVRAFPFGVRCSGVSLSFNLCITVFSSSTPIALIFIENNFKSVIAPGIYTASLLALSFGATHLLQIKHGASFNKNKEESFLYLSQQNKFYSEVNYDSL